MKVPCCMQAVHGNICSCRTKTEVSESSLNDGLCNLKSMFAKNSISNLIENLELRVSKHHYGDWEITPEALAIYQNDIQVLKNLGV